MYSQPEFEAAKKIAVSALDQDSAEILRQASQL